MVILAQTDLMQWSLEHYGLPGLLVIIIAILMYRVIRIQIKIWENRADNDNEKQKRELQADDEQRLQNREILEERNQRIVRLESKLDEIHHENVDLRDELNVLHETYSQSLLEKQELQWKLDLCIQQMDIQFDANDEIITRHPVAPPEQNSDTIEESHSD